MYYFSKQFARDLMISVGSSKSSWRSFSESCLRWTLATRAAPLRFKCGGFRSAVKKSRWQRQESANWRPRNGSPQSNGRLHVYYVHFLCRAYGRGAADRQSGSELSLKMTQFSSDAVVTSAASIIFIFSS